MRKRLLSLVLCVAIAASLMVPVHAAGLSTTVNNVQASRGDTVTFTVTLSEAVTVTSGAVTVTYDSNVLSLDSGTWMVANPMLNTYDKTKDLGAFAYMAATEISGAIFQLQFTVLSGAAFGTTSVSCDIQLKDANKAAIAVTNYSGSMVVACTNHNFTAQNTAEKYLKSPATCTAVAAYYYSCTECGAIGSDFFESGSTLPHNFDRQVTLEKYLKAAVSCENAATYYYSCVCGETGTELFTIGEALPHVYDQIVAAEKFLEKGATCDTKAIYYKSCKCGAVGTERFEYGEALGHTGGTATCTAPATCTRCGNPYGTALEHEYDNKVMTEQYLKSAVSCTNAAEYFYSCDCGKAGTEFFTDGEPLPHTFDQLVAEEKFVAQAVSCDKPATYYKSCKCGAVGTDTFETGEALGHTGGWASCTELAVCTRCGTSYGKLLDHTYDQEVATEAYLKDAATCTAKAVYYKSCKCGAKGTEPFEHGEALGHTGGTATCTTQASCSRCGTPYGELADHAYTNKVVSDVYFKAAATCTGAAEYYYSCTCGEKGTEFFANGEPLPHTFDQSIAEEKFVAQAVSCDKPATYYKSCKCGAVGTETFETGEALGHTGGTATCTAQAVCTRCGASYGELLAHTYDQIVATDAYLKDAATCTTKAVYYKSCKCGLKGTDTFEHGEALGHTGGTATCTAQAVCTRCGVSYGEILAHTYDQKTATETYLKDAATCTTKAVYYKSCKCGLKGNDTFEHGEALGHTGGTATCTTQAVCTRCNASYGDLLPHVYDKKVTTDDYLKAAATCQKAAEYYYSCECGAVGTETFSHGETIPHTFDKKVEKEAYIKSVSSCEAPAEYYMSCACGEASKTDSFTGAAPIGHTGGSASCTRKAVCTRCNKEYGDVAPHSYNHSEVASQYLKSEATCTSAAVYYMSCSCGEKGSRTFESGSALGHTGGTATCTKQAACDRCGASYGELKAHTYDKQVTSDKYLSAAATCIKAAEYYYSCACGEKGNSVFTSGSAKGHTYDTVWSSDATNHWHKCTACGDKGDLTAHTTADADCTSDVVCTACQAVVKTAEGHKYEEQVVQPTCTEQGYTNYTCANCGDSYKDNYTEVVAHSEGEWIVDKEPTEDEEGSRHTECAVCKITVNTEAIPALSAKDDAEGCGSMVAFTSILAILLPAGIMLAKKKD